MKRFTMACTFAAAYLSTAATFGGDRAPIVSPYHGNLELFDASIGSGMSPRGVGPGMQAAADEIIADQCPNGGWNWPHGGCSATYYNITGPIGLGLLHAYANTYDPDHLAAAVAAGNYDMTYVYSPGGEARFSAFTSYFLWQLSLATGNSIYSNHVASGFFDELNAGTYGPANLNTAGWIAAVQTARTGAWVNLRPWEFHNIIPTAGVLGNPGQQALFTAACRDGLDTLNNIAPATVYSDLIGLAGGVRGLAFAGATSFTAISAPNHAGVNGITTLQGLADLLAGYQNADGSWYWHSNLGLLGGATDSDKDTQTTAYAILALLEAGPLVASDYSTQIARGRDWLRTMQLPDGGFLSYPGGEQNTEVEAEALAALAPDGCTTNKLVFTVPAVSLCVQPGEAVTVELHQLNLTEPVRGYQAWGQFDSGAMAFVSGVYTTTPFGQPVIAPITASGDNFDIAAGIVTGSQSPTSADALLATLTFDTTGMPDGSTTVSFRYRDPPSRFTRVDGTELTPCLVQSPRIIIDGTVPVIACPADTTIDCGDSTLPADTGYATATDNIDDAPAVTWSDSSTGGCPNTITRTWVATDCAGNVATCVQTIVVNDTTPPTIQCPEAVTVECDESILPDYTGFPGHFQGFEDPDFSAPPVTTGYPDWQQYASYVTRVSSGSGGITSAAGAAHAIITPSGGSTGAFTRLGGYDSTFDNGFATSVDVYIDLTDPAVAARTYGFDISTAVNNQSGGHRRDFIFHAAADDNTNLGAVLIAGSNNSNFAKRNDLETLNHYAVTSSGWYTFQWVFRDFGDGTLAVDLNLRDAGGALLWTETRHNAADIIATEIGGHRYMWFTFVTVDELAIDNTTAGFGSAFASDDCDPAPTVTYSDTQVAGACPQERVITRTWTATDACGNTATCTQIITVEDSTPPAFTYAPPDVTIECDESTVPALPYGTIDGGVMVVYNGLLENPTQQAYMRAQFSQTNTNGAAFTFSNAPLTGNGYNWTMLYGQVGPPSQFGFDLVLEVPTATIPIPYPTAYENTDNSLAGRADAGSVRWAINNYAESAPNGPGNPANQVINSLIRSAAGPNPNPLVDIEILSMNLVSTPPIWTMTISGVLHSDGMHHWYTPSTPDSPLSNFGLNGDFYFSGTLTYNQTEDVTAGGDFYAGTITLLANSPNAALGFALATDNCELFPVVSYTDGPMTGGCSNSTGMFERTWTATDACGNQSSYVQTITVVDTTPPVVDAGPDPAAVPADAGECTAGVTWSAASAADNCPGTLTTVYDIDEGNNGSVEVTGQSGTSHVFPVGTHKVTARVSDGCGNEGSDFFLVTVLGINELNVDVALDATGVNGTRCITFQLWQCSPLGGPVTVDALITFSAGMATDVVIPVPCGDYSCITARDKLHTLRRSATPAISGTQYDVSFTGTDTLIGGNLNDDFWVDILDFGVYSYQYNVNYESGNTTCSTPYPHADISGNGVVFTEDFTFVQQKFLQGHEPNCCGQAGVMGDDGRIIYQGEIEGEPLMSISITELEARGMGELAAGDLNGDGMLDMLDVIEFLAGARPGDAVVPTGAPPAEVTPVRVAPARGMPARVRRP